MKVSWSFTLPFQQLFPQTFAVSSSPQVLIVVFRMEFLELAHKVVDVLPASLLQARRWWTRDPQVANLEQ